MPTIWLQFCYRSAELQSVKIMNNLLGTRKEKFTEHCEPLPLPNTLGDTKYISMS